MELAGAASMAIFQSSAGRTVVVVVAAGAAHASSDASSNSLDIAGSGGCSSNVWSMDRSAAVLDGWPPVGVGIKKLYQLVYREQCTGAVVDIVPADKKSSHSAFPQPLEADNKAGPESPRQTIPRQTISQHSTEIRLPWAGNSLDPRQIRVNLPWVSAVDRPRQTRFLNL